MGKPCYKQIPKNQERSSNKKVSNGNEIIKQEIEIIRDLIKSKLKDQKNIEKAAHILGELLKEKK